MGAPITLETTFSGMRQDDPRDNIQNDAIWNCIDFIPQKLGAPLRKRNGWLYASPDFGSTQVIGMCRTPSYGAGAFNIAVDSASNVYTFTDNAQTLIGTATQIQQNPVVHRKDATNWLVIIPDATGAAAPKSWDGTTFGSLGGAPPFGIYAEVWNDRSVLANSAANPGRVWFSQLGNGASWDTVKAWYDFSEPVRGLATLRNSLLIFHRRSTERLKGTTPASATTVGDLISDRPFEIGCMDPQTIVKYNDTVIWADITGVYQTDGNAIKDLTAAGGMGSFWFGMLLNLTESWTFSAGVAHDTYIITIMNGVNFVDCLCYDLVRGFWYRMRNMPGRCYMRVPGDTAEKVYMGLGNDGRVGSLYVLFFPSSQMEADADGTLIQPVLETGYYRGTTTAGGKSRPSFSLQQWKWLFLNWDMHSNSSTAPVLNIEYIKNPSDIVYLAMNPVYESSGVSKRARREIGAQSAGVAFKLTQVGGSADTRIHGLEAEFQPLEENRLRQ